MTAQGAGGSAGGTLRGRSSCRGRRLANRSVSCAVNPCCYRSAVLISNAERWGGAARRGAAAKAMSELAMDRAILGGQLIDRVLIVGIRRGTFFPSIFSVPLFSLPPACNLTKCHLLHTDPW